MQQSPVVATVGPGAGLAIGPGSNLPVSPWALASDVGVDLDFVNDRGFNMGSLIAVSTSFITVSRASAGYADDANGVWSSFSNNVARRTNKGLLVEEARTNGIRNNSIQGAVVGAARAAGGAITTISRTASATASVVTTSAHNLQVNDLVTVSGCAVTTYNGTFPVASTVDSTHFTYLTTTNTTDAGGGSPVYSGLTIGTIPINWQGPGVAPVSGLGVTVVGIGTTQGIDYIDIRYSGVTTSTSAYAAVFENNSTIAAVQNDVFTTSLFYALTATGSGSGSTAGFTWASDNVEYPAGVDRPGTLVNPTSILTRASVAITVVGATAANIQPRVTVGSMTNNTYYDFTMRYGWPQCEKGSFVTSPIRTTNAAATRAADVVTLTSVPSFGLGYSVYNEALTGPNDTVSNQQLIQVDDGSGNNRIIMDRGNGAPGNAEGRSISGGSSTTLIGATWATLTSRKIMFADANADQALVFNGNAAVTGAGTLPVGPVTAVRIGGASGGSIWNGFIKRVGIWPTMRISNAQMQSLTT